MYSDEHLAQTQENRIAEILRKFPGERWKRKIQWVMTPSTGIKRKEEFCCSCPLQPKKGRSSFLPHQLTTTFEQKGH